MTEHKNIELILKSPQAAQHPQYFCTPLNCLGRVLYSTTNTLKKFFCSSAAEPCPLFDTF